MMENSSFLIVLEHKYQNGVNELEQSGLELVSARGEPFYESYSSVR